MRDERLGSRGRERDARGWKVARLFSRLEARVFRPAMAMFTANDAVLPFPLRQALDRVNDQLERLIYDALPLAKAS